MAEPGAHAAVIGRHAERGSTLAETALVVALSLMVVFNALQIALLGFHQIHADAAAFAVARLQALTGSAVTAENWVTSSLKPTPSAYTASLANGISQATASATTGGILFVTGSGNVTVNGSFEEVAAPSGSGLNPNFSISTPTAQTTIANYFPSGRFNQSGNGTAHSVYLAQHYDPGGNGNANGPFHEWLDHANCYAKINFPGSYASTQSNVTGNNYKVDNSNPWVNYRSNSAEGTIYGWDDGSSGTC